MEALIWNEWGSAQQVGLRCEVYGKNNWSSLSTKVIRVRPAGRRLLEKGGKLSLLAFVGFMRVYALTRNHNYTTSGMCWMHKCCAENAISFNSRLKTALIVLLLSVSLAPELERTEDVRRERGLWLIGRLADRHEVRLNFLCRKTERETSERGQSANPETVQEKIIWMTCYDLHSHQISTQLNTWGGFPPTQRLTFFRSTVSRMLLWLVVDQTPF